MKRDYPSDWNSRRRRVYKRDRYTCQNCGVSGGKTGNAELHAHHIVPKSKGGTHKESNLITICKDCHKAVHGNSIAPSSQSSGYISQLKDNIALVELAEVQILSVKYSNLAVGILNGSAENLDEYETCRRELIQGVTGSRYRPKR